jgi:hypothetical protein
MEIMIPRYPIARQGKGDVEESASKYIGVRHFGDLGVERITEESRNSKLRRVPQGVAPGESTGVHPYRGSGLGRVRELMQRESRYPDT